MSLTIAQGPLAVRAPQTVNYTIDGPAHRLYMHEFPRRIRAVFGEQRYGDAIIRHRHAQRSGGVLQVAESAPLAFRHQQPQTRIDFFISVGEQRASGCR